jgi:MFS family permease
MKRWLWAVMLIIGIIGAVLMVAAVVLAITEGYLSDEEGRRGNIVPSVVTLFAGACLMAVGFGTILFTRR